MRRCLVAIALLAASVTRAQEAAPAGPLPDTVIPMHYRVSLSIDPRQTNFSGRVDIDTMVRAPLHTIWLHGLGLHVSSVTVTPSGVTTGPAGSSVAADAARARRAAKSARAALYVGFEKIDRRSKALMARRRLFFEPLDEGTELALAE